jgi:regulator of sigma E protease
MLDEREAPVPTQERHLAFNTQSLRKRALIVAAGPVANLLLAVMLYAVVNWSGVELASPVLGRPVAGSVAERAGLMGGERVARAGFEGEALLPTASYEDVRWLLMRGALEGRDVRLALTGDDDRAAGEVVLPLAELEASDADARLFERIGIVSPMSRPLIGEISVGSAAEHDGLQTGDLILSIDGQPVVDARQLRELIRASVRDGRAQTSSWRIEREGAMHVVNVTPGLVQQAEGMIGRIGAYVGEAPEMVTVHYGPIDGLWLGMTRTWEVSALTLRTMGRMVVGEASLKNLSGPLTIADYAGRSASLGLTQYLIFLALISVSLGVLNLLPIPVLDGGHLMYYLWEGLTGRAVSDVWLDRLQRVGVVMLSFMMAIAIFNDLSRHLG